MAAISSILAIYRRNLRSESPEFAEEITVDQHHRQLPAIQCRDTTASGETWTEHLPVLMQRFNVSDLALFGSTARDTASEYSDIDILVAFDGIATSERYFGVWWIR